MVFSDSTNKLGIVEDIDFLCGLTDVSQYPIEQKTRNVNERFRQVLTWIFEAYGGAIFDDSNQTDLPEATYPLSADVDAYALPDFLSIEGMEIKDTGGVWHKLQPITAEQIRDKSGSISEFLKTSSIPRFYRILGNCVILLPAPNYTQSASLKFYFTRDVTQFTSTDTTKKPGFASAFHRALSVGAALDWAVVNDPDSVPKLMRMWSNIPSAAYSEEGFEQRIKKFYSQRFKEMFPGRLTVRDGVAEMM